MTNFSDNVQKAMNYLKSKGINEIYTMEGTDLSENYPDGFIFIPTKDHSIITEVWCMLVDFDKSDDTWGVGVTEAPSKSDLDCMTCVKF